MLHKSHKFLALLMAGAVMLSFNSCGLMEMRDCYVETEEAEETTERMLASAEWVNQVIQRPEEEETTLTAADEIRDVTVTLTGDVLVDTGILMDASAGAYDGQSYSFLTMYTGLYGCIHGADVAMMSYSTADHLADHTEQNPPVEAAAALFELGADVLDTTGCCDVKSLMEKQGLTDISSDSGTFELVESGGVTFAFMAVDSVDDEVFENLRQASDASDITVVSVTWNDEQTYNDRNAVVRALASAGADVVAGKGAGLGTVEWLDNGNGTRTLAAYSLGNILATSGKTADLLGGVLTFTVSTDKKQIEQVSLEPTFTHYTAEYRDYQVFRLATYSDELAVYHANSGVYTSVLNDIVCGTVPVEFLPAAYKG